MHNNDDKYPSRPGFEPGTPRLQDPVDTNEPSGPAALSVIPLAPLKIGLMLCSYGKYCSLKSMKIIEKVRWFLK